MTSIAPAPDSASTLTMPWWEVRSPSLSDRVHIRPAYGYLDYVLEQDDRATLGGWMLLHDGAFDDFVIVTQHGDTFPVQTIEKPVLAELFPSIPGAERGGFHVEGCIPRDLGPRSTLETVIIGRRGGRNVAGMTFDFHRPPSRPVFPPSDVMRRATGNPDRQFWLANGIKDCNDFRRYLARHIDLSTVGSLLDWGCGSGRVTRHLIDRFPQARVYGNDIDREAVAWAGRNLDGEFAPCGLGPPLPHADRKFDLVIALSVFTHLTREYQSLWLEELRRVIRPGGVLLVTTHGRFAGRWNFPDAREFDRVFETGFYDAFRDENLGDVASGDYYKSTYQTNEHTFDTWSDYFDIVDYIEGGLHNFQDIYILKNTRRW